MPDIEPSRPALVYAIDDDAGLRHILSRALPGMGYRYRVFEESEELARECAHLLPDIVLSDVSLGSADGIAACLRLRRLYPRLRIVIMTADPDEGDRASGAGFGPALLKPFSLGELRDALA